eukprot:5601774-Ditylum_brightwellii.AAC.1
MCSEGAGDVRRVPVGVLQFKGEILSKFHVGIGTNNEHASFWGCVADFGKSYPEVVEVFLGLAQIWGEREANDAGNTVDKPAIYWVGLAYVCPSILA